MSSSQSQSFSYSTSSFGTSSSSSTGPAGQSYSQRYTSGTTSNDRDGSTTVRTFEESGKPTIRETTTTPAAGRMVGGGDSGRIEDVSEKEEEEGQSQEARDRLYEERMENEYAKREGGA